MREAADRPWLDCYYAAAMPMRAQLGLSGPQARPDRAGARAGAALASAAAAAPARAAGPPPMPRERGMFAGMFTSPKPIVKNMPMQSYVMDKNGAFTVTLPTARSGNRSPKTQVYHPARWRKAAPRMEVTITPDAMHIYLMTVKDEDKMYKVNRIH